MRNDFAIFIMSYNRANNISTLHTLNKAGYTGKYYIIVGDDDPSLELYKQLYNDNLYIFSKEQIEPLFDTYDNNGSQKCIVYARNYCFILAKQLNLKYFLQFDDDYIELAYRYPLDGKLKICNIKEFDKIVNICIDFLEDTQALSIALPHTANLLKNHIKKFVDMQKHVEILLLQNCLKIKMKNEILKHNK